ncbi:MAG: PQQ-like beta-propeller repeat protein [Planctomycetaceae bacterium]|nr:PQQ-like beta-propeller repeat protein [Planctomycetaceae bacterium]
MKHLIPLILLVLLNTGLVVSEESWPVFHGPKGDNKSADENLLKSWPENGPPLLWTADFLGFGYSGVTIANGRIFITGNETQGQGDDVLSMLYCLDMEGKLLWKSENGSGWNDSRKYPSTRATPTIDGKYVYDETPLGQVACFEAETGKKIWTRNILEDFDAKNIQWALAESVVIDGNNVICCPGGEKASVAALDKLTGKTVWEAKPSGFPASYATPYLFDFEGMHIAAVTTEGNLLGINAENGEVLFAHPFANKLKINATIPIYKEGTLFMTSGYGGGAYLIRLKKDGNVLAAEEIWAEKSFDNQHGGIVMVGDYVYGTTHNGRWGSIKFTDGTIGYMERGIGKGSIHYADGLLYGLSENGRKAALIEPTPEKYTQISEFVLPNEAEGPTWAHPVVCGGKLYIRHAQYLYCFDVRQK